MTREKSAQLRRRKPGGIDRGIGAIAQARHEFALEVDSVHQRAVLGQRVTAPGLGVAMGQHLVVAIEVQEPNVKVRARQQGPQLSEETLGGEIARSDVDVGGDRAVARRRTGSSIALQQVCEQRQRNVVDRLIAQIFEHFQCRRLSGAGHPGDQYNPSPGIRRGCVIGAYVHRIHHTARRRAEGKGGGRAQAGSETTKRAPRIRPSAPRRFAAAMVPPCASAMRREMLSPSPEWTPAASPRGRSV